MIGLLTAAAFRALPERRRLFYFVGAGAALVAAGYLFSPLLPINKRIWTSSFVLLSSGVSLLCFSGLLLLPPRGWAAALAYPLRVLGANAILAFILSQLLGVVSVLLIVPSSHGMLSPQEWGYGIASRLTPDPYLSSLTCAVAILVFIVLAIVPLHRRGIHLRV